MNPARLSVRFAASDAPADLAPTIEMFHRFIQRGLVEGLILDVADYRHVPDGPGVLLVGHDVDYGVTESAFTTVRKRHAHDDAATQLRDVLRLGLGTLDAIADDGQVGASFDRSRLTVTAFDRRLGAPAEAAEALHAELAPVIAELYGAEATVDTVVADDPRQAPRLEVSADPTAAASVLGQLGGARPPGQSPWDISVERLAELRREGADFVLLDVREDSEYETVNLGGTNIPLATLTDRLEELDPEDRIVVHCRAGRRGATAVEQLRDAGFTDAWNVNGALMTWAERIDPSMTVG